MVSTNNSPMPSEAGICRECGSPIPADWPRGLCSRCALDGALELSGAGSQVPPRVARDTVALASPIPAAGGTDPAGRRLGDYELIEEIARGGMGIVYRARQTRLNRVVALKMILSGQFASKPEVLRFRGEAEAAANLHHPNIVAIHETGEQDGHHYFSMEFVPGRDLADIVRDGPVPAQRAARYAQVIAEAIHYAHQHGVLHRDLKPSNILIDANDQPRITDFGLAKRVRGGFGLTVTGQVLGSPSFMPPEQASGESAKVGPPSDVYGLGAILYHLLTGRPPFQAEAMEDVLVQLREVDPVSPRLLNPSIPRDLETLCLKCLEKDPAKRYATAQALAEELGRFLRGEPIQAHPVGPPERIWRWCRRKPVLALLIVLLHLVGATGLVGILWQWRRAEHNAAGERRERARAEVQTYAADMNLAQQALAANNLGRARELLDRHRPRPGQPDPRGWEWRYLWQETRGDERLTLCQKPAPIFSLAVSPDSKLLAVGERNYGHLTVWDLPERREIARFPDGDHPDIFYIRAAFSPTEPLLAYSSSSGFPPTNLVTRVRLWDFQNHRLVAEWPLEFLCSGIAFSTDGRSLITSTPLGTKLWDVHSGELRASWPGGSHQGVGTPFANTPDLRLIAQAESGGNLRVLDLTQDQVLWNTRLADGTAEAVALSPDGLLLATGGGSEGSQVHLWNARNGELLARITARPTGVTQLLFLPDGKTLVSGNADQTIGIWDVSRPSEIPPPRILIGHELEVWRLAVTADGRTLISGGKDGAVRLWDLQGSPRPRGPVQLVAHPSGSEASPTRPNPVSQTRRAFVGWSFADAGDRILTCDNAGQIVHWTGQRWETATALMEVGDSVVAACFLPDRNEVAAAYDNGDVKVWNWVKRGAGRLLLNIPGNGWEWLLHRHGARLAVGRFDQLTLHDFDLQCWEEREAWEAPGTLAAFDFTPDGRYCVMGGYRGRVMVRDLTAGRTLSPVPNVPNISSVRASPDGRFVAIAHEQGFVELWDPGTWRQLGRLGGFLHSAGGTVFSQDRLRLAAGSSGAEAVRLFELDHRQPLITLAGRGALFSPRFSPSGDCLAAANAEGEILIWSAPSWSQIAAQENRAPPAP